MTQFNQQGQQVQSQHNIGRDMNVGAVQSTQDLISVLEQLNQAFKKAENEGVLTDEAATDAQYQVTKAVQQAKKPDPDKNAIVKHLTTAKGLIEGLGSAGELGSFIVAAIEMVHKLF